MVTSESYDEYKKEYNASLNRIRSYLAGSTRNRTIMMECDRRLSDAKRCATAMQAMAEIEGNAHRMAEAQTLLERDIAPLAKEIQRQLGGGGGGNHIGGSSASPWSSQNQQQQQRQELFYQAPDIESNTNNNGDGGDGDGMMDSLIESSDDLLRDSQSILAQTEEIGTRTLLQMGRQREQIENSNQHLTALQSATNQAKAILSSMVYRAWRSKMTLYFMIACLTCANLYVLYYIFVLKHRRHHHQQAPSSNGNGDDGDGDNDNNLR